MIDREPAISSDNTFTSDIYIDEIYKLILSIRRMVDTENQIESTIHYSENTLSVWQRTVDFTITSKNSNNNKLHHYNYLRLFFTYLIAAITLAKIYKFDSDDFLKNVQHIQAGHWKNFQERLITNDEAAILQPLSEGKSYLIALIKIYLSLDDLAINTMLDQAKDWAALAQPSFQIMTTIQLNEKFSHKKIIILDTPCSELTPEQKENFLNLSEKKWFLELGPFHQQLILHYKESILSGKCVIPSQLRALVPACKNSYRQTIFVEDANGCKELNTYFHCGSVAHVSHGDEPVAADITKLNLLQQKFASQAHACVMICLNSSLSDSIAGSYEKYYGRDYSADDSIILQLTDAAALQLQEQHIYTAKICLNGFRRIEFNNYAGIDKLMDWIKINIKSINENETTKNLHEEIKKINALQNQLAIFDYEVKGLDIIHCLTKIVSMNNQLAYQHGEHTLKTAAVWFGCASGENRTGITYFNTICQSIIDYFEQEKTSPLTASEKNEIYTSIADSEHIHIMTGNQGSTFGTEGIREKSILSFKPSHPKMKLITPTSNMKKLPPNDVAFNMALDRLIEALPLADNHASLKSLSSIAKQLLINAKKLSPEIVFMSDEDKKIHQDSLLLTTHLLYKLNASLISDLNTLILKIKQKITTEKGELADLNNLLIQFSTTALKLSPNRTQSKSIFQSPNQRNEAPAGPAPKTLVDNTFQPISSQ